LDLVLLVARREGVAQDLVLPLAKTRRGLVERDDLAIDLRRLGEHTLLPVEFGEGLEHLGRVVAAHSLEEIPRLVRAGPRRTRVGLDQVLLGFLLERTGLVLRNLAVLAKLDDLDEDLERALEIAEVDLDPALLVESKTEHRGAGELLDLLVELAGVLHLALAEVELGEGQVGVGNVLRLRVVLDQAVEELARLVFLLDHLQEVGEAERAPRPCGCTSGTWRPRRSS
jgi:hypothetical protein